MPRAGGKRDGVVGRKYQNRTDLQGQNVVAAQPSNQPGQKMVAQAASGQAYGAAGAQLAAQKAVPIANQPGPVVSAPTQGQATTPPPAPPTPLDAPTDHGLPLTHGMDIGPGAGSEALPQTFDAGITIKALGLLNSLGSDVSPQVAMIRSYLQASAANGATR